MFLKNTYLFLFLASIVNCVFSNTTTYIHTTDSSGELFKDKTPLIVYLNKDYEVCVIATTQLIFCKIYVALLNSYSYIIGPMDRPEKTLPTCISQSKVMKHMKIICLGVRIIDSSTKLVYKKDLATEVINETSVTSETDTHVLIHFINVTVKSNPFLLQWKIGDTILTAGETSNDVRACRQLLIDDFTYVVTLSFVKTKKPFNKRFSMILKYPNETFIYSAPLSSRKHRCCTKAINCNTTVQSNEQDFQTSTFFIGLGVGVATMITLLFIMRLTICRPPRPRLATPPPEPEDYAEVYTWRMPVRHNVVPNKI